MSEAPVKLLERLMHGERREPDEQVQTCTCSICVHHLHWCSNITWLLVRLTISMLCAHGVQCVQPCYPVLHYSRYANPVMFDSAYLRVLPQCQHGINCISVTKLLHQPCQA